MLRLIRAFVLILIVVICNTAPFADEGGGNVSSKVKGFVNLQDIAPSIVADMRYYSSHNFVGTRINGYNAHKCLLTTPSAMALASLQSELLGFGLSLKVYDCYRPQRAVDHFMKWAENVTDNKMQGEFYPALTKQDIFGKGYVWKRSSHSKGSTVDLTIVPVPTPEQESYKDGDTLRDCRLAQSKRYGDNSIDMGSGFDCFDEIAHTASPVISAQQRANRILLKTLMEKHGFVNYENEWWHYTYKDEPFPDTYFDFPIDHIDPIE